MTFPKNVVHLKCNEKTIKKLNIIGAFREENQMIRIEGTAAAPVYIDERLANNTVKVLLENGKTIILQV